MDNLYEQLNGPALVTIAYFVLWYYLILILQTKVKKKLFAEHRAAKTKFDRYFGHDKEMLWADRVVINTQEQMLPFLFALWLFSFYVSASIGTALGAVYIVLRCIYPSLLKKRIVEGSKPIHYTVTLPAYLIIIGMFVATAINILI